MTPRRIVRAGAVALLLTLTACGSDGDDEATTDTPAAPAAGSSSTAAASGGASPVAACTKDSLETRADGKLTVGTDKPAYGPWFSDDDPTNGKGFESAVAYAVAQELGFTRDEVAWTTASFNSVIAPGPKDFDFDVNQVSITDERKAAIDFSSGYYDVSQAVVALEDSEFASVTTVAELKSAKLGGQVGTTSLRTAQEVVDPDKDPAVYNDNDAAKAALNAGQIDALVVDLPTALYITAAELEGAKIVGQFEQTGDTPEQFGLVLDKGSSLTSCVSAAVDALREDGTLDELEAQWLTTEAGAPFLT